MPKSKKRGGEKAHRKRVAKRKALMENNQRRISNLWNEEIMKEMEKLRAEQETQSTDGNEQPDNLTPSQG